MVVVAEWLIVALPLDVGCCVGTGVDVSLEGGCWVRGCWCRCRWMLDVGAWGSFVG